MDGASFDFQSMQRIARTVQRVERWPKSSTPPTDTITAAPVLIEVRIGTKATDGSGSGSGSGSSSGSGSGVGDCTIPLWSGEALVWNGCGWDDDGEVWVFPPGGGELSSGVQCLTRLIDSHFLRDSDDPASERPLCEVISSGGGRKRIRVVTKVCLIDSSGSGSGV